MAEIPKKSDVDRAFEDVLETTFVEKVSDGGEIEKVDTTKHKEVVEAVQKTLDRLGKRVDELEENDQVAEALEVKMQIQKIELLKRRLVKLGMKIVTERLSRENKEQVAGEVLEVAHELRKYVLSLDVAGESVAKFDEHSFKYTSERVDDYYKELINTYGKRLKVADSLNPYIQEKKQVLELLDRVSTEQMFLKEGYYSGKNHIARFYLYSLHRNLGKSARALFDAILERRDAGEVSHAIAVLEAGVDEAVDLGSVAGQLENLFDRNGKILEMFDKMVTAGTASTHNEEIALMYSAQQDDYEILKEYGVFGEDFGFTEADQEQIAFTLESQRTFLETMKGVKFGVYLEQVGEFNELLTKSGSERKIPAKDLIAIYKKLYETFGEVSPAKVGPVVAEKVDTTMKSIKRELIARKTTEKVLPEMRKFRQWFKYFDLVEQYDEKGSTIIGYDLTARPEYLDLIDAVQTGKATKKQVETLDDIKEALNNINEIKAPYIDKVNEKLCEEWEKNFYEAVKLLRTSSKDSANASFVKAKALFLKYKEAFDEKYGDDPAKLERMMQSPTYQRTISGLKEIGKLQMATVMHELDRLQDTANAKKLKVDHSSDPDFDSKMRNILDSQYKTMALVKQLLAADNAFVDVTDVIYAIGQVDSVDELEDLFAKNGLEVDEQYLSDMWGDWNKNGVAFWRGKFGTKFEKKTETLTTTYKGSGFFYNSYLDILRTEAFGIKKRKELMPDYISVRDDRRALNWELIESIESEGFYGKGESYYRRHFADREFYKKFEKKFNLSADNWRYELDVIERGEIEKEIEEWINQMHTSNELLKMFGDKKYDEPYEKWKKDPELRAYLNVLREKFIDQKYERYLHEKIMDDEEVKKLYDYFDSETEIMGKTYDTKWKATSAAYKKILKDGLPVALFGPGESGQESGYRPLTEEEALMIQFGTYDDDYKEWNSSWNIFRMTLAETDRFIKTLPLDLATIMLSAGASQAVGKAVTKGIAKSALAQRWAPVLAKQLANSEVKQLFLRGAFREAAKMLIKQAPVRLPGFLTEATLFTGMQVAFNWLRSGCNMRILTDWKGNLKQLGHSVVTLGMLRVTGLPTMKLMHRMRGLTGVGGSMARGLGGGVVMVGSDTLGMTVGGAAFDAVLGETIDGDYMKSAVKNNVIMAIGIRAGHGILNTIGAPMSPGARKLKMQKGYDKQVMKEAKEGEAPFSEAEFKWFADVEQRSLDAEGKGKGKNRDLVNTDSLVDGLTPDQARRVMIAAESGLVPLDMWKRLDTKQKLEVFEFVKKGKEVTRQEFMDLAKSTEDIDSAKLKMLLLEGVKMPKLISEDIETLFDSNVEVFEIVLQRLSKTKEGLEAIQGMSIEFWEKLGLDKNTVLELDSLVNDFLYGSEADAEAALKKIPGVIKGLNSKLSTLGLNTLSVLWLSVLASCGSSPEAAAQAASDPSYFWRAWVIVTILSNLVLGGDLLVQRLRKSPLRGSAAEMSDIGNTVLTEANKQKKKYDKSTRDGETKFDENLADRTTEARNRIGEIKDIQDSLTGLETFLTKNPLTDKPFENADKQILIRHLRGLGIPRKTIDTALKGKNRLSEFYDAVFDLLGEYKEELISSSMNVSPGIRENIERAIKNPAVVANLRSIESFLKSNPLDHIPDRLAPDTVGDSVLKSLEGLGIANPPEFVKGQTTVKDFKARVEKAIDARIKSILNLPADASPELVGKTKALALDGHTASTLENIDTFFEKGDVDKLTKGDLNRVLEGPEINNIRARLLALGIDAPAVDMGFAGKRTANELSKAIKVLVEAKIRALLKLNPTDTQALVDSKKSKLAEELKKLGGELEWDLVKGSAEGEWDLAKEPDEADSLKSGGELGSLVYLSKLEGRRAENIPKFVEDAYEASMDSVIADLGRLEKSLHKMAKRYKAFNPGEPSAQTAVETQLKDLKDHKKSVLKQLTKVIDLCKSYSDVDAVLAKKAEMAKKKGSVTMKEALEEIKKELEKEFEILDDFVSEMNITGTRDVVHGKDRQVWTTWGKVATAVDALLVVVALTVAFWPDDKNPAQGQQAVLSPVEEASTKGAAETAAVTTEQAEENTAAAESATGVTIIEEGAVDMVIMLLDKMGGDEPATIKINLAYGKGDQIEIMPDSDNKKAAKAAHEYIRGVMEGVAIKGVKYPKDTAELKKELLKKAKKIEELVPIGISP